jgi:hypothetical protein
MSKDRSHASPLQSPENDIYDILNEPTLSHSSTSKRSFVGRLFSNPRTGRIDRILTVLFSTSVLGYLGISIAVVLNGFHVPNSEPVALFSAVAAELGGFGIAIKSFVQMFRETFSTKVSVQRSVQEQLCWESKAKRLQQKPQEVRNSVRAAINRDLKRTEGLSGFLLGKLEAVGLLPTIVSATWLFLDHFDGKLSNISPLQAVVIGLAISYLYIIPLRYKRDRLRDQLEVLSMADDMEKSISGGTRKRKSGKKADST